MEFKELFHSLIDFCKEFEIKYDFTVFHHKDDSYAQYRIISLNDCSIYSFKTKILNLGSEGVQRLKEELEVTDKEYRLSYISEIREELSALKNIIEKDNIIYSEDQLSGEIEEENFRRFKVVKFTRVGKEDKKGHNKSILLKSESYVDAWLHGIDEIDRKIEFLANQLQLINNPESKDKNQLIIFYSWQTDLISEKKIIQKSLNRFVKDFKGSDKNISIESDMRGTSGSQDIPNTLFSKIRKSDVFIADVNLIGKSLFREEFMPNSNVMIELGYAAGVIGWDRIVLLFNTSDYKIEQLPFDIRQRSVLKYNSEDSLKAQLKTYVGKIIETID